MLSQPILMVTAARQSWAVLLNGFAVRSYKCFRKNVAIFQASIAFHGSSAVV